MMGRAQAVASVSVRVHIAEIGYAGACPHLNRCPAGGAKNLEGLAAGENQRDLVGEGVHLVPEGAIGLRLGAATRRLPGIADVDKGARAPVLPIARRPGQIDEAVGIVRNHLADAT